jgi:hypothetical protein
VRNAFVRQGRMAGVVLDVIKRERQAALDALARGESGNLAFYTLSAFFEREAVRRSINVSRAVRRHWVQVVADRDRMTKKEYIQFLSICAKELIDGDDDSPEVDLTSLEADWVEDACGNDHLDLAGFHAALFQLVDKWTNSVEEDVYAAVLQCFVVVQPVTGQSQLSAVCCLSVPVRLLLLLPLLLLLLHWIQHCFTLLLSMQVPSPPGSSVRRGRP